MSASVAATADAANDVGRAAFARGDFDGAVTAFSAAITALRASGATLDADHTPLLVKYLTNRAAAAFHLRNFCEGSVCVCVCPRTGAAVVSGAGGVSRWPWLLP